MGFLETIQASRSSIHYPKLLIDSLHNFPLLALTIQTIFDTVCRDMFCIIDSISATGLFGYLEVDLGVIVGSYWIHICSSLVNVSCVCSLAID